MYNTRVVGIRMRSGGGHYVERNFQYSSFGTLFTSLTYTSTILYYVYHIICLFIYS